MKIVWPHLKSHLQRRQGVGCTVTISKSIRKKKDVALLFDADESIICLSLQIQTLTFPVDVATVSTEQSVEIASSPCSKHKRRSSYIGVSENLNHTHIYLSFYSPSFMHH